ncbi:MAG: efflux RND transporter permease subunit [Candidatus Omnitrophica bacterium]|nr:efflux RND transporter permease subunit [Candidatus Omnitrophota bacterium]
MNPIEYFVKKPLFVNLISVFVLLVGIIAIIALPREAFPPVNYDIVTVMTIYRNATAQEVEKLVTIPLEDELKELSGLKEMTSVSEENLSTIVIELDPNAKNKNKIVNEIQRAVDRVNDLPDDAEDPVVDEIETGEIPIIQVAMSGNVEEKVLRRYAEALEDKLIDIPEVSSIGKNGWRDPEIWVEIDPEKTKEYYISLLEIAAALATRNINLPGGTLEQNGEEYMIRTVGEFETADEIKKVVVRANDLGNWITIEDIAKVKDTFEEDSIFYRTNGTRSINLVVIKREGADAIDLVNKVKTTCTEFQKALPPEISISYVDDFSYYIKRRLRVLVSNACIGIVLVVLSLLFFLTWRLALLTAVGLPIAFATTFGIMLYYGISINLLSMFGMIIVVGMLVDDAIIIAENTYRYIEQGIPPREAAIRGTKEVALPVTSTVLTTIAAFVPLLLMTGIMGKFVRNIPIVVIIALSASLLEALIILPSHIADFAKPQAKEHSESHWYRYILCFYSRLISFAVKHRYMILVLSLALLVGSVGLAKYGMKFRLFSSEGLEEFFVNIEAPIGTPMEMTEKYAEEVEQIINKLPKTEIENFVTSIGIKQTSRDSADAERGSHLAMITVFTTPANSRKRTVSDMVDQLRKDAEHITGFDVKFEKPSPGPPVGKPIAVRLKGNSFEELQKMADTFKEMLASIKGVKDIDDDYNVGKNELRIIVDEKQAAKAFLTYSKIARAVNAAFAGGIATTIKTTSDEIDVRIKFREQEQKDIKTFDEILIQNSRGNLIPFNQVARVEEYPGLATIKHLDKKRVLTVTADINDDITTSLEVNEALKKLYEPIKEKNPDITVIFGGEQEDTEESMQSLGRAFILAAFLIFLILATTFQSLMQPLIVMLAIPFGLVGVILTFYVHGRPLSFMCMLGVIGLSGIVVNDSIVLIEFINKLRQQGVAAHESIVEACKLRLRPVILTTVTTVLGLLPTAYGWGGNDPFIKPMALAMAWGLFFATATTLIIIPCVTAIVDDVRKKIGHVQLIKLNGKYMNGI